MEKLMNESREIQEIRQRMAEVRYVIEDDVQNITDDARVMTDWRQYVKSYPWACLGAAAALGYLVVPRRFILKGVQPNSETLAEFAKQYQAVAGRKAPAQDSVRSTLLKFVGKQVAWAVLSYVGQHANKIMTPRATVSAQDNQP